MTLYRTVFPIKTRTFKNKRWLKITLRTFHLIGIAGVGAGAFFHLRLRRVYRKSQGNSIRLPLDDPGPQSAGLRRIDPLDSTFPGAGKRRIRNPQATNPGPGLCV